jgi:4-hydroxybenzoate polyprenyltransferase
MNAAAGLLKLTRFPLVFTAMADSAAGYLLAGGPRSWRFLLVAAVSALLYAAGMVFNDLADRERDRKLHPERPLPSGRVTIRAALIFGAILLGAAVLGSAILGLWPALATVGLIVLILAYDGVAKRVRIAGAATMAAIRGLNLILGGLASLSQIHPWGPMAVLAAYVFLLTLWSTYEDTAVGKPMLAPLGAALVLAPGLGIFTQGGVRAWVFFAPIAWMLPWVGRAILRPGRERMMQVVRWGVLGIILLDAAFVAAAGRWVGSLAIAALLIPALALLPAFRKL